MPVLLALLLLMGWNLSATPANDDPCDAISLDVLTSCTPTTFSNVAATASSGVIFPGCGLYTGGDVWFTFTLPNNGYHVMLEATMGTMSNGAMAVYSGSCGSLSLVSCDDFTDGSLTIRAEDGCSFEDAGSTFYLRVWDEANTNNGTFDLCAYAVPTEVPSGAVGCGSFTPPGNTCCDAMLLSDGFDGYCGSTNGYTDDPASIPAFCAFLDNNSWVAFVASEESVELEITSSNCAFNKGVQVAILETTDCVNFAIKSNCWNPGVVGTGTVTATNLVPGEIYYLMVDGWAGDICDYTVQVISGVQTTEVTVSNDSICAGQSVQLNAEVIGAGPFSFNWSPSGSLDDPTSQNPIATPLSPTTYSVTITGADDPHYSVFVHVDVNTPPAPTVDGDAAVCEGTTGVVYITTATASSYSWSVTGGGTIVGSNTGSSVIVDWGSTGGDVCLSLSNSCGAGTPGCLSVNTIVEPDITASDPAPVCAPTTVDLSSIPISNSALGGGPTSFYATEAAAIAGTPMLSSPVVATGGVYWIRMDSGPGCFDYTSVNVVIQDPQIIVNAPPVTCQPNTVNLSSLLINELNSVGPPSGLFYFTDSLDGVNNINALASPVVTTGGTYWVRYETALGCFDVAPVEINIFPQADVSLDHTPTICSGQSIDLDTISFTDANSTTISSKTFHNSYALALSGFLPLSNTVVTTSGPWYMRLVTDDGCPSIVEINVDILSLPELSFTAPANVCAGEDIDLEFTLVGTAPFTIVYNDGTTDITIPSIITNTHTESITINATTTFSLVSLSDASVCSGQLNTSPITVTANPAPTASISGTTALCTGSSTDLTFNFSGTGPFDIVYSDGTNNINETGLTDGATIAVNPTTTTTYTLISVEDASGCTGSVSGSAVVTVSQPIQIINLAETCNAAFSGYTVAFEIIGGDAGSYLVTGGTGSLVGNQFTSTEIAAGTAYSFTVSDASGCPAVSVTGSQNCNCTNDAGTMSLTQIDVCEGQTVTVPMVSGVVLEAGHIQRYVLHDNPGGVLGTVYATSTMPTFGLVGGVMLNTVYYVSSIVGPDDGTGEVDVLHACFDASPGTPVRFIEAPDATLSGTTTICSGSSTDLTISIPNGVGPFEVVYSDGTNNVLLSGVSDGHTFTVNPTLTTTYSLVSIEDGNSCTGTTMGDAIVTVNQPLQIVNLVETCNSAYNGYTVSFEITGGDAASYAVTGGAGTLMGNQFTSDEITAGMTYNFTVVDLGPCPAVSTSGLQNCDCGDDAGTMSASLVEVCQNSTLTVPASTGVNLEPGHLLQYILHDNAGASIGTVYATSSTPDFSFVNGMLVNTTYYVSAIVGPDDGTGNVDDAHVCFDIAEGTPVTFLEAPEAAISGTTAICNGGTATLTFNFTAGVGPFDVVYSDGTQDISLDDINDGHTVNVIPTITTTYTITSVLDNSTAACPGSSIASATITVNDAPVASPVVYECDNTNTSFRVIFTVSGGDNASYTIGGDPGSFDNTTQTFTSDWLSNGTTYTFDIDDANNCGPTIVTGTYECPCTSFSGNMDSNTLEACEGETVSFTHMGNEVLDGNDVLGYILHDGGATTPGTIMMTNNIPEFSFGPPLTLGQTYFVSAVVADDNGSGFPVTDIALDRCLSISDGQPVRFDPITEAWITGSTVLCEGDSTPIVFNFADPGVYDVVWSDGVDNYTATGLSHGDQVMVRPTVTTTYTLINSESSTASRCASTIDPSTAQVTISVTDVPEAENFTIDCDNMGLFYTVSFDIAGGDPSNYTVNGNAGTLVGNTFTSEQILSGSAYLFEITDGSGCPPVVLTAIEYCKCTPDIEASISVAEAISCPETTDGVLSASNVNGEGPFRYIWSTGSEDTQITDLAPGWYYVTMTDANLCTRVDSILLTPPDPITADALGVTTTCFGDDDGMIELSNINGGTGNYTFGIENLVIDYSDPTFYNLEGGEYNVIITDENGCTGAVPVEVPEPDELIVDLGEDIVLSFGDSIDLYAFTNMPVDSISWTPDDVMDCTTCLTQNVKPFLSTLYSIEVLDGSGCRSTDEINIFVERDPKVYIPNAFSPNGDGNNDFFTVYTGNSVSRVHTFKVFSRWGEEVFSTDELDTRDEETGWNGRFRGRLMSSGIYTYFTEIEFIDGSREVFKGSVNLIHW